MSQMPDTATKQETQGETIILNERSFPAYWGQWKTSAGLRYGVSDTTLGQAFGFELLRNRQWQTQPIQWFAQSAPGLQQLSARLTGQARLLDITDLARQAGWRLTVSGKSLRIDTPGTQIMAIRAGVQPWGDRLVLELDRPTTWQTIQQPTQATVVLDAQIDPTILASVKPQFSEAVKGLNLVPKGKQTQIQLDTNRPVRVWSLTNPNRLVIDVRPDALVERDIVWAPGVRWRSQLISLDTAQFPVTWLELDPKQAGLQLAPILPNPNQMQGIAPLADTARRNQVAAAINGGFFNRNNQLPLGAVRQQGRWLSGPILGRGAIAWNGPDILMDRLVLQETLILPRERLPITHLNSGFVQAGIARYTPTWGATYTTLSNQELVVTVQGDRVVAQQTIATPGGVVPIPANGYLLVARSFGSVAQRLAIGTALKVESQTAPTSFSQYPNIVAAGPLLVQNRQIVLNAAQEGFSPAFINERAARSIAVRTSDGRLLLMTVHNRLDGPGPSLSETAELMVKMGAIDALNLDGGSSTTLYLGGQIINLPPRGIARVHNGLGILILRNP